MGAVTFPEWLRQMDAQALCEAAGSPSTHARTDWLGRDPAYPGERKPSGIHTIERLHGLRAEQWAQSGYTLKLLPREAGAYLDWVRGPSVLCAPASLRAASLMPEWKMLSPDDWLWVCTEDVSRHIVSGVEEGLRWAQHTLIEVDGLMRLGWKPVLR